MSEKAVGAKDAQNKVRPVRVIFVNRFFYPDESATSLMLTDLAFALESQPYAVNILSFSTCSALSHCCDWRGAAI